MVGWWLAKEGRLEHDTPWFRIVWNRDTEPPSDVAISGDIVTQVAFGDEIGLPASEFSVIAEAVRTIMNAFLAEFPETQYVE